MKTVLSRNIEGKKHADPCTGRAGALLRGIYFIFRKIRTIGGGMC
jgi:hypothetical protein